MNKFPRLSCGVPGQPLGWTLTRATPSLSGIFLHGFTCYSGDRTTPVLVVHRYLAAISYRTFQKTVPRQYLQEVKHLFVLDSEHFEDNVALTQNRFSMDSCKGATQNGFHLRMRLRLSQWRIIKCL